MKIRHDTLNKKFYFDEEGKKGHIKYNSNDADILDLQSTFIDEDIRGQGYGKELVKYVLEYARENNFKVIPTCRMVSTYIKRNKEYNSLVV
ncbi:MAG: N-acetyltransferase [Bacteroidota bacterium]|nr:N-acetyltransferase [Bacteroidota bacterium]